MTNTHETSRRDFMKTSTLALAGAPLWGSLSVAHGAYAAGRDEIRVGLVGCGGRGTGAAGNCLNVKDNVKIVAMGDLFPDRVDRSLKALKNKYKTKVDVPRDQIFLGFDAYEKVLGLDLDYVIFATPPVFRYVHYAAAVKAGKNVFLEKPCCIDAPAYRSMMETNKLADEKGIKVAVGLQRRHSKTYLEWLKQVHDGIVGDIRSIRVYWNGGFAGNGYKDRVPGQGEMEFQIRNWYNFRWLSGDHIVEQHVHNLDVACWIMKDAHPVEANGMGGQQVRKRSQNFDHHSVEFTYADGTQVYSQCRQIPGCWSSVTEVVHGTKGVKELGTNGSDGYNNEHADLVAAIRNDTHLNDGWHGANSSFTGVLGRMATYSGKVVRWDEAVAKGPDEGPKVCSLGADPPVVPDADGTYHSAVPMPGVYKAY